MCVKTVFIHIYLGEFHPDLRIQIKLLIRRIALTMCTMPPEVLVSRNLKLFFLQNVGLFEQ